MSNRRDPEAIIRRVKALADRWDGIDSEVAKAYSRQLYAALAIHRTDGLQPQEDT